MSRWRFFALALYVVLLSGALLRGVDHSRRPDPWARPRVPVRWVDDGALAVADPDPRREVGQPDVVMQDGPPSEWSSGTAFAVADGVLVTAAHVTNDCAQLAVGPEGARSELEFATGVVQHAGADAAAVAVAHAAPTLALGDDAALARGALAWGIGYPSGQPAVVTGELMGRARGRGEHARRYAPVLVWALVDREPAADAPLGGISGGPLLGADGRVLGIVIASAADRRSRFITTTVAPIADVAAGALGRAPSPAGAPEPLARETAASVGALFRARGTVVPMICRKPEARRPERG